MRIKSVCVTILCCLLLTSCERVSMKGKSSYDVVVYGGTSSGVIAAVQVARMGKTVALVCPEQHLGGMTSGGLGYTDSGNTSTIGGLSRKFYQSVWTCYRDPQAWTWQSRESYGNQGQGSPAVDAKKRTMWCFEPHVAEAVFEGMVKANEIPVFRDQWLDRDKGVKKREGRIQSIRMVSGKRFNANMFIDATYEGDLMAASGVAYHVGREANAVYGETFNGVQKNVFHHGHHFKTNIDPYVTPGDPASGLLPRIASEDPGENGQGDDRVQAYCYRMCLTQVPQNCVPFKKPKGYDPAQYELLARVLATGWNEVFAKFDPIPNSKTDTNNHGPFSTDNIGMNYDYPEASYAQRAKILEEHTQYQKGLMYFLSHDARVPQDIRQKMSQWGLARDEFADNEHWPYQIYVREARRMIGAYVMTELDCLSKRETPKPVGMGSYTMDSHNVQRYVTKEGFVQDEGDIGVHIPKPYAISYNSLTPKKDQCENLLVPVCASTSHIAYGTIRMEPVFMILGQSAATAACQAIDSRVAVQDVDYGKLREQLVADGQVLDSVIADAEANDAVGLRAVPDTVEIFKPGQAYDRLPSPVANTVLMSAGTRYTHLARLVAQGRGTFTQDSAIRLMDAPVAMTSNLHDALMVPEDGVLYIANADKEAHPAWQQKYYRFDIRQLIKERP